MDNKVEIIYDSLGYSVYQGDYLMEINDVDGLKAAKRAAENAAELYDFIGYCVVSVRAA